MSPAAGTRATLPAGTHRHPDPLDAAGLVVTHIDEKGVQRATYDFALLPVPIEVQRSLADTFARHAGPGGPWRSLPTSREMWGLLRSFARFLAEQDDPPARVEEITAATWLQWRLSRPDTAIGQRQIVRIGAFLRTDPTLPESTRTATLKRVTAVVPSETCYTAEEFDEIKTTAERVFEQAWDRITANSRHLNDWHAGRFHYRPNNRNWHLGDALDHLARTGDVVLDPRALARGQRVVPASHAAAVGGADPDSTWLRLFLTNVEVVSLAVLMVIEYGWNSTSISELDIPEASSQPDGALIHRVELEKRRRREPLRYETRNLTDWGPRSPGRLITQAVDATAPARHLLAILGAPTRRLLLWHLHRPLLVEDRTALIRVGFGPAEIRQWRITTGVASLNLRRLRRTVTVLHRRTPTQHSQDVHDSVYVLPDPAAHQQAVPVIADGVADAIAHAHSVVNARIDTDKSADIGADTVTATCSDYQRSPFSAHGSGCRASFLLCLACANAVITARHLPRLTYLHRALDQLRATLPDAVWDHDWREHHARLTNLRHTAFTATEWADAAATLDPADRALIDSLLHRELDA